MPAEDEPPARSYEESTAFWLTEKAFEELENGVLHGEVIISRGIVRSHVWGECPACAHHLDDRQTHTAVTGVFGGEWRGTTRENGDTGQSYHQVDVSCGCGHTHPGAPAGKTGCGASFRVELLMQPGEDADQA
jgi:hypothetical protein